MASQYINLSDNINVAFDKINENFEAHDSSLSALSSLNAVLVGESISLPDNTYLNFGNSNDLRIYHNGSNSMIQDNGVGNIIIQSSNGNGVTLRGNLATDKMAEFKTDNSVELYYNNVKKFETTLIGIDVDGKVVGDSASFINIVATNINTSNIDATNMRSDSLFTVHGDSDKMRLYSDVSSSYIKSTQALRIHGNDVLIRTSSDDKTLMFGGGTGNYVRLYNDGVAKLETTDSGVNILGSLSATGKVKAPIENQNTTGNDVTFWVGTQSEYDAIGTPDANTLYFIK